MSFINEVHICYMCKEPIEKPEPVGTRCDTTGWLHPQCAIARDVAERLNPKPKFMGGMEVRMKNKFIYQRKV